MLVTLFGIVMLVKPVQPSNAYEGMFFTFSPIVTLDNLVQLSKTREPIVLQFSALNITLVKPLQPRYLQPVITQYFACNKSEIWS